MHHVYNFGSLQHTVVSSPQALAPGRHTVHYEFVYDGGQQVGEARVPRTMPFGYSGDEGVNVGTDNKTPVTAAYKAGNNKFTGKIHKVTVEMK